MSKPFFEILIIFVLLLANGIFAMAEIAIISARKTRLQELANSGSAHARTALELSSKPNQFLATVQIGITLVGILAGVFGGATIAEEIAQSLSYIPFLAPYSEAIGVGIVVLIITYFSLIIGELVPKRLALNNAERVASDLAAPMWALSKLAAPVVQLLSASTDLIIKILGIELTKTTSITPEEIKILIEQGKQSGAFEESEQDMIENILGLDEMRVDEIMTPRTQIAWFDINDKPEDIRNKIAVRKYSRYPVVKENLDNVLGIVRAVDLLSQSLECQPFDIGATLQQPLFIPKNISALKVLELLKEKGAHIALVTDEFGGIAGLVTHNNILEDIGGHIHSTDERAEPGATRRDDGSWLLDGLVHVDKFIEIFGIEKLLDEEPRLYQTVGGFVITQLGSIPSVGQHFEWGNLRLEVVDMDGRRVDKVLITQAPNTGRENT